MYDIIGDVHGHAEKLEALLRLMQYEKINGTWQHPERTLISVGDLIDRGPQQRKSVDIIRRMTEEGFAKCIMGNHEFNAVAWATPDENGGYLRPHSDKNYQQHQAFLAEAQNDEQWYQSTIEWFKTLPIYLELPELRVVHACWHKASIDVLDAHTTSTNTLHDSAWKLATDESHPLFQAIEVLSKGWEVPLPEGHSFLDKDGNRRTRIRTQWWQENDTSYQSLAIGVSNPSRLPAEPIPEQAMPGYDNQKPLFLGHYWMKGEPCLQSRMIACVDWSVADGGSMVAYRWDDNPLNEAGFYQVK